MAFSVRLTMTPKGSSKFAALKTALRTAAMEAVTLGATALRDEAARRAPNQREEAQLVSMGVAGGAGRHGGGLMGTPEGGRHIPEGPGIQAAILADPITASPTTFGAIATTGDAVRINTAAAFSWITKTRGTVGPTKPFNGNLLGALEDGGVWVVTPRPGGHLLEPSPGVAAGRMTKTIHPRNMFKGAAGAGWISLSASVVAALKTRIQAVGLS